ncbi:MAG: metal ABC transporter permease [Proteobacteria bacterium]|nr:metal ABC transporter permease [Pseudomonadota bacterium]
MLENFSLISIFTIIACAISCAMLGNLVLWKKLSFYGDAMSHSTLFGVAIGVFLEANQIIVLIIFNLFFASLINLFSRQKSFAIDSVVMIFSYFFIACAVLFNENFNKNFEFEEFLFGDISQISKTHLILISVLCALIMAYIYFYLDKLLISIINSDIATVRNINQNQINFYFMILLSLMIAFAIKVTGIFLITALMIIPSACARIFSKKPLEMIVKSIIIGVGVSLFGLLIASNYKLSIAPTIIFIHCIIFFILLIIKNSRYAKI